MVVTSFSNDGSARPTMLLKTQSSSNILTDQVRKLQNSFFKEHLRKAAPVLQQAHYLRASHDSILQKALPLKLTGTLNGSNFASRLLYFV